jgi:hypothetical protein
MPSRPARMRKGRHHNLSTPPAPNLAFFGSANVDFSVFPCDMFDFVGFHSNDRLQEVSALCMLDRTYSGACSLRRLSPTSTSVSHGRATSMMS